MITLCLIALDMRCSKYGYAELFSTAAPNLHAFLSQNSIRVANTGQSVFTLEVCDMNLDSDRLTI
jgi:hypothetical protein